MKKNFLAASVVLALGAGVAADALAQAKPDVLVAQRQAAMKLQGKYLGPIGGMLKGAAPYNADVVALNATFLENLARMPWDGFQPSTSGEKSAAKPKSTRTRRNSRRLRMRSKPLPPSLVLWHVPRMKPECGPTSVPLPKPAEVATTNSA